MFGSITKEPLDLLKFSCYFLSFLDNLLNDAHIIVQKDVDNFEIEHKTCQFGVGGSVSPFKLTFTGKTREKQEHLNRRATSFDREDFYV